MTDAQKIEEGAIIDAREDFEAIKKWLEVQKLKVKNFEIKHPGRIYGGLSLLSLGYFFGLRADKRISWLLQVFSGAVFGYSAVNLWAEYNREKKKREESGIEMLKNAHIIEPDE